jgi:TRAP-type C4-dicarboxylate transport system permease small subunit
MLFQLRRLNRWVALAVGLVFLTCAALVLLDIVLRRISSSLGGTDEIAGYVMAIGTAWGMAFAMLELAHVRIDFLRTLAVSKIRAVLDLMSMCTMAISTSVIAYWCWPVVATTLKNSSHANTPLETPLVIVQIPWFAGWVWFAIMGWLTMCAGLLLVFQSRFEMAEKAIGVFPEHEAV